MNEHFVWDVDPVLVTLTVDWIKILGLGAAVILAAAAGFYFWRARKRGSEDDRSVAWTLVTVLAVTVAVSLFVKKPLEIRYYGILFAAALFAGYYLMRWQFRRGGLGDERAEALFLYAALGIIIGARLGHVIFYEPDRFFKDAQSMVEILYIWNGGLASHGAGLGTLLAIWLYNRKYKVGYIEVTDRLSMSIALCSGFIRVGNFMNSEIVGREWHGPWAVVFPRYMGEGNMLPRHPSQIYEVLMSVAVFVILYLVDRHYKETRPRGLITSMLFIGYFTLRFCVEFFKEFQVEALISNQFPVTMGQLLSLPFVVLGIVGVVLALRKGRYEPPAQETEEKTGEKKPAYRTGKKKKKKKKG